MCVFFSALHNAVSTESTLKFAAQACKIKVAPARVKAKTNWKALGKKYAAFKAEKFFGLVRITKLYLRESLLF